MTKEWAWGGSTGKGVKVGIVDSGIDDSHPEVGAVAGWVAFEYDIAVDGRVRTTDGRHDDAHGHGTACAGIVRAAAPDVELYSLKVFGPSLKGKARVFAAAVRWAIEHELDVVNMSLSTSNPDWFGPFHELADRAYFSRTALVCAINNYEALSYPSEFASVISVAAHEGMDPLSLDYNPAGPVEFGAPGLDVRVPWPGGGWLTTTGNSFAAPHVAGLVALILGKHRGLAPFQVKSILQAVSNLAQ